MKEKPGDYLSSFVQNVADRMAELISHKLTNSSALVAVVEVKVETTVINNHIDNRKYTSI